MTIVHNIYKEVICACSFLFFLFVIFFVKKRGGEKLYKGVHNENV